MNGTRSMNVMSVIRSGGTMTDNSKLIRDVVNGKPKAIKRYNVFVSDMFKDTKQPKKHQERFIRKLLGDDAYYKRWQKKKQSK
jgi:hypothetical protein|tara:strand:+ start:200 stop:448 length:249 start_codon:yes stop_codon:yes gene_type:complete